MNKNLKLQETKNRLKSDFVGLDSIIDRIVDSITPWYLTPEILERPTVVSLWGLTGTGKTSLIRKLVNYLGISEKSLFFDCGEQGGDTDMKLFSDKLDDLFESSRIQEDDPRYSKEDLQELGLDLESPKVITKTDPLDYTFVFDEFQYLNTKDPQTGDEERRPEGRAIWSLMDSGVVDINRYNYKVKTLMDYIEDLEFFSEEHPGVIINNGRFDKSMNQVLKKQLSYYRWAGDEVEEEEKKDTGYNVLFDEDYSFFIRKLNILQKGLGFEVGEKMTTITSLDDFIKYVKKYISLISKPKVINCSRSLIFILGNLDEAFELTGEDLDPDIDADIYHEMTSKVSCMDIKTALRKRFRDEQVGRMGNNIIIYPSLRRCDFEEIITRELRRIISKFGGTIEITESLRRLIYSEGCFPIQGVRPLFSTINTIISPLLSIVVMNPEKEKYILDTSLGETNFDVPKITLQVRDGEGEVVGEKEINLTLGALRSPGRCKKIGLQAIHEASHSVVYHVLTGKYPSAIVASNVFGDGGYMMNEVNLDSSTDNIRDMKNDVMVSLAGYYGEREFFDPDMCSLGTSSDLCSVWERLRQAFYEAGIKTPIRISEPGVSQENEGLPFGFLGTGGDIEKSLSDFFEGLCKETREIIHRESLAIKKVASRLCDTRSMGAQEFKEIISKYLAGEPSRGDDNYYTNIIRNEQKQRN